MDPLQPHLNLLNRRQFFGNTARGLGCAALASLFSRDLFASIAQSGQTPDPNDLAIPHFIPKAKRVIFLFMSGGPSQMDMWDYKPVMEQHFDKDLPDSIR